MESLERLQTELLHGTDGDVLEFWEYQTRGKRRTDFRPRLETEIARRIAAHLRRDLSGSQSAIIRREAEVQWDERRTDIEVIVHGRSALGAEEWTVTIETKGCWNRGLRTAPKNQLARRYLIECGRTHGIYLVAWFRTLTGARRTKLRQTTRAAVEADFRALCQRTVENEPGLKVEPFILDCRRP